MAYEVLPWSELRSATQKYWVSPARTMLRLHTGHEHLGTVAVLCTQDLGPELRPQHSQISLRRCILSFCRMQLPRERV